MGAVKKILHYIFCMFLAIVVYEVLIFIVSMFFMGIFENAEGEINMVTLAVFQFIMFVAFTIVYLRLYVVRNEKYEAEFLSRTQAGYDRKEDLIEELKTNGKSEIITYALYSFPFYFFVQYGINIGLLSLIYVSQNIFYIIIPIPIVAYFVNIIVFALAYLACVFFVHNRWDAAKPHR